MKRFMKSAMAGLLALLMLIQTADSGIAYAVGELEKALNPAEQIELTVPERFQDGNNWFFIPEQGYTASEKSADKLYIPIQRAGDLDTEAEITLKVSDISARHDVNYKVELYKDRTEPEIVFDDQSVVDLILNADGQIEYEAVESESEFGEIINAVGEAEIVDGEGNVVGTVTATPLDEDGNPIMEAEEVVTEAAAPEEAEAEAATEEAVTEAEAAEEESEEAAEEVTEEAVEEAAEEVEETEAEETEEAALMDTVAEKSFVMKAWKKAKAAVESYVLKAETVEETAEAAEEVAETAEAVEMETEETVELVDAAEAAEEMEAEAVEEEAALLESDWTAGDLSSPAALRAARNAYTGVISDRQELAGGDLYDFNAAALNANLMSEDEYNEAMASAVQDSYPGKEYTLHFSAGEAAKFLVITPMYSEAAEGDAQIMLMLKNPGEGWQIGEDVNPVSVTIFDEDEPEPVTVSMANETVIAEDGVAQITITRNGRLNAIKGVTVASWDGSAAQGDEYSGIGAKLYFPMGIQSRTVEIPVYHGTEEKDFYVSITALDDEIVESATTRVIIPAAGEQDDGTAELMGQSRLWGSPELSDRINIRDGYTGKAGYYDDYGGWIETPVNKKNEEAYIVMYTGKYGYAYDGMYLEYSAFINWAHGDVWLEYNSGSGWRNVSSDHWESAGNVSNQWLGDYWGQPKAPGRASFTANVTKVTGYVGTKSKILAGTTNVQLIKRKFDIKVEKAEVKPLIGVSDNVVLEKYQSVFLDHKSTDSRTLWTDEAFSVTAKNTDSPLRLAGLEAKNTDGKWVRIVTIDGKSSTANVTMNADKINELAAKNVITWNEVSTGGGWYNSYKGSMTVRPVFEYINTTVEVRQDGKGELYMSGPNPTILWDFDKAETFKSKMGVSWQNQIEYVGSGYTQEPNYFTFTAKGNDPFVSIETPVSDASNIKWGKVRAYYSDRNNSPNIKMEFFASCGNANYGIGNTNVQVPITGDAQWHEYVFQVNGNWKGDVKWLRLDPMHGCKNGDAIAIDYVAFFPDEASARAYRSEAHTAGTYTYHLGDTPSFRTVMTTLGNNSNLKPDGVSYQLRKFSETGVMKDWTDTHYINGQKSLTFTGAALNIHEKADQPHYTLRPFFTENGNCVTVEVSKAALNYLDTSKGIFKSGNYVSRAESGNNWIYTIKKDVQSNIVIDMTAYEKTPGAVLPYWSGGSGTSSYSNSYSFRTGEAKASNKVTLKVFVASTGTLMAADGEDEEGVLMADAPMAPTYASITGTVVSSTFNLKVERSAVDMIPAKSAFVSCGSVGTWTDEEGNFELPAIFTMGGGQITYLVTYNGVTSIHTAKIPAPNSTKSDKPTMTGSMVQAVTANVGVVKVENFSETGAHFDSAYAEQEGRLFGTVNGMFMNGKELIVTVNVDKGQQYYVDDELVDENIKDVTLYFMDQMTGEVHAQFSSNVTPERDSLAKWSYDAENGVFTLRIPQFGPNNPTDWTYGDVLMAQLITDKRSAISEWTQDQDQKYAWDEAKGEWVVVDVGERDVVDMVYEPISTGIAVAADPDYEPQTLDMEFDNIAETLGVQPQTDEDGELLSDDDDTRYSFGSFPYIGEITALIKVLSKVSSSATGSAEMTSLMNDLQSMTGDEEEEGMDFGDDDVDAGEQASGSGGKTRNATLNILLKVDETQWGGVRFMFGLIVSSGTGKGYQTQRNPFNTWNSFVASNAYASQDTSGFLISETYKGGKAPKVSEYGGGYFKFSAFIGAYWDFGYVEISKENGREKSHEMVFMGAGGFIGFNGNLGYTWAFMAGPVPMYINVDALLSVTFFLGSEGDPQTTLQGFKNSKELKGQDFQFNFEFKGRIYVAGTIGVGLYKFVGVRITVGLGFDAGYGLNITKWYPNLFDTGWGYTADVTFTGSIDLLVTSIDLYSATWPLPIGDGYVEYFQEVKRANKCISYVENGIQAGNGSASDRAHAQELVNQLKEMVDANELMAKAGAGNKPELVSVDTIKDRTSELKSYAWHHDIISWVAKNSIEMTKQAGVIGAIINGTLQGDTAALQDAAEPGIHYHTNDHVNSRWVANDGQLMAAYGNASSKAIVENSYNQPASRIMDIGGGKYLMVFLDDTAERDKMQAATLTWTVYDTTNDTWTDPQIVQNDSTVDGKPALTDAGDKVILTWASATDAKYDALKAEFAAELQAKNGAEPTNSQVQKAMEDDPARVMRIMDVFSVEFDKASESFGEITQLTDDNFYDDYPQAVYDSETGDYIVMYYKTAQNDAKYSDPGDKLQDIAAASPDPDKTYSVIAYMLYNNQSGAADTNGDTHEPGWARDYYFPNETAESPDEQVRSLTNYGGQRFLPSTLREEDGGQSDPPIIDLTMSAGYNGLAAYAFTVDKDFDLNTSEDRELYVQFYDFASHSTYVPIRIAGSVTETSEKYDAVADEFTTVETVRQVDVGSPRLIRNGGNTYLFWREDGQTLKYLNISETLNTKVAAVANPGDENESDWTWAVKTDGTFATDAATGRTYEPRIYKVDFGSLLTNEEIEITDYDVITAVNGDQEDLYVVWTDAVVSDGVDQDGMDTTVTAQEIFASAMIHQDPVNEVVTNEDGEEETRTTQTVRWSKPYRLTREDNFNDGLALALDPDGNLMVVHNQYSKLIARSEQEMLELIDDGKIGVTKGPNGQLYAASLAYNSPVNLMLTRFEKIGSLEATVFEYSDYNPVGGETINVTAAIENVGLMDAEGSKAEFYKYKDGVRGAKIFEYSSDEKIQVNTARSVSFNWTIPANGPDGYSIEAVISEKKADGGYYEPVSSFSDVFTAEAFYRVKATEVTQEGDQFRVKFTASNAGNLAAPEGTTISLRLAGLYGDLNSDRYGNLESNELYSADITSALPGKTLQEKTEMDAYAVPQSSVYEGDVLVDIPASVFRYCGYDAIQAVISDSAGNVLADSDQLYVAMTQPVNLNLNGGEAMHLDVNASAQAALRYDTTVFFDEGTVVYSVDDPSVAVVDEEGNITGLDNGTVELLATMVPSGRSVSVPVSVGTGVKEGETPTPTPTPTPGGSSSGNKQGCYVATSVYGSYDCPEVWTLRRFRDEVLAETWYGRLFIRAYYAVSPTAVKLFGDCEWFQNFFRARLDQMVSGLQSDGFASTPYEDRAW